jgi:hypothetical protein
MMIFRLPHVPFGFVHNPFFPGLEKRHFDFLMASTMSVSLEGDVKLPAGYRVAYVPETFSMKNAYGVWSISFEVKGKNRIHYRYAYTLNKKCVPVADYPQFKKIFDDYARPQNRLILLEKAKGRK